MSLINDYTVTLLADQRRADLMAEARHDRLVRDARGLRPSFFRDLVSGLSRGRYQPEYRPVVCNPR